VWCVLGNPKEETEAQSRLQTSKQAVRQLVLRACADGFSPAYSRTRADSIFPGGTGQAGKELLFLVFSDGHSKASFILGSRDGRC
jgi:hypothetical protein